MKKILLSMVAILFAVCANAQTEVTFDFDKDATALFGVEGRSSGSNDSYVAAGEFNENGVVTVNGVTITVEASAADAQTRNRLWTSSPVLRMYNGNLTVAAPGHKVTKIVFNAGSNFNIASVSAGALDGKTWVSDADVAEVVFTIQKNTQIKSMVVTLDGKIGDTTDPVVIDGTGEGTVASPYDVARALSLIKNDMVSSQKVYIAGKITKIDEVSTSYGNATYLIGQGDLELKIYRGYSLGGDKFTSADEIKVGDEVVVYGQLVTGYGGQVTTGSSLYSINGKTKTEPETPPYEVVGDGSQANPYTVADVVALNKLETDGNKYWVKGYILGCAASATTLAEGDKIGDTNIAIGATADAKTFIPVAIPVGDLRTILGVATNPNNVGKEVIVYGTLEKYFSVAGVKNVTEAVFDNVQTGINAVTVNNVDADTMFNLAGQKVNAGYKGVIIKGGKKFVNK